MRLGYLTREADSLERAQRAQFLNDWSLDEKPTAEIGLGGVERKCAICGSDWVRLEDGTEGCQRDRRHLEMLERVIEPMVAEPLPDPRSPRRMGWRRWRHGEAPEAVGADEQASEALQALSEAISTVLESLERADTACRASTAALEQQTTAAAMAGGTLRKEWKPGFRRAAATLRELSETAGDISVDSPDLPRIRQTLGALQLVLQLATEEAG